MNEYTQQSGCPNRACINYKSADDSQIAVHDKKTKRFRCRACGKTWATHYEEFHYGLRSEKMKINRATEMIKAGLSIRQIAKFAKVSPSTVLRWKKRLQTNNN